MADHNIYIHAIGTGSATNQNPTIPWSQRESGGAFSQTQSQSTGSNFEGQGMNAAKAITKAAGYAQNPDSIVSAGVAALVKVLPWVAAAYAVVKVGVSITDNVLDFQALETGDYRDQVNWLNFKQVINNIFHPVSTLVQAHKTNIQWANQNYKAKQQRDLLGDSVINSYTNKGV